MSQPFVRANPGNELCESYKLNGGAVQLVGTWQHV